ncbi:PASTA domain-containing protein [Isoptericola cucumis]|uniref:PASTA domain-containing protein n=1 Tax=Isoptericola cucumis TaxID=1776856 RepID=UPI00166580C8|nr:PASTA domain-containing protein [Isoptericola cucumis]
MTVVRDADQVERREQRKRGHGLARVVGIATTVAVLSAGLVALPVVGAPGDAEHLHAAQDLPVAGAGSPEGEGVSIGVVGETTTTGPTSVAEVLAVLERAELAAEDAGREYTREIEQAAAEVGMLLSTYLAQQADAGLRTPEAVPQAAPVVQAATSPADGPADVSTADAAPVSRVVEPPTSPADAVQDAAAEVPEVTESGPVTFDDVVVAATRLANLLDPASESSADAVLPADGLSGDSSRATLTAGLRAVVDKYAGSTAGFANGRIPTSVLCPLDFAQGHMLRCDAAAQLTALNALYEKEFGVPIPMTDSYRPYDVQVRLKVIKPYLAATPGTSNHGWGVAVDLSTPISSGTSAEYRWLRVHGPDFGWDNPSWARLDGSKPEPWHFEFFASGPIPDRAWDSADVGRWDGDGHGAPVDKAGHDDDGKQPADKRSGDRKSSPDQKQRSDKKGSADEQKTGSGGKDSGGTGGTGGTGGKDSGGKGSGNGSGGTGGSDGGSRPGTGGDGPGTGETVQKVTVPNLAGQSVTTAKTKLKALGLRVTTTTQASDEPQGQVLENTGAGQKVRTGWTVTLVVSSGPALVTIPDLEGLTVAEATEQLEALGFVVVTDPAEGVGPEDLVVETRGAGTKVPEGSTVTIDWSDMVVVPDVTGLTVAEARDELEPLGFVVVTDPAEGVEPEDEVVESPDADAAVAKGSEVVLAVETEDAVKSGDEG